MSGFSGFRSRSSTLPDLLQQAHERLALALERLRGRRLLWVPVGLGMGAAPYAGLAQEPSLPLLGAACCFAVAVMAVAWQLQRRGLALILFMAALPLFGMSAAALETARLAQPLLPLPARVFDVTGTVEDVVPGSGRTRVLLTDLILPGLSPAETPQRIRIALTGRSSLPAPGDRISLRARLGPAAAPAEPGAFDYRHHAYFQGIGGSGYAVSRLDPAQIQPGAAPASLLAQLRLSIDARIGAVLQGDSAGLAAALITGHRGGLSPALEQAMRDSGLAHLISISGLHVAMLAAIVMGSLRLALAAVPWIALRWPVKKLSALAALAAVVFYTALVGAPVPTQRAAIMTALVLLAIVFDRNPFSLRSVALAATVLLLVAPSSLVGPSAQMSFSAVAALIAGYEALQRRRAKAEPRERGWLGRAGTWLGGLVLTSLIASLATAPFSLYHFQQLSLVGVVANAVAVPLSGLVVMPAGFLACLLMPLGLEALPLQVMGWGLDGIIATAHAAAALPAARIVTPAMPLAVFLLLVTAGLWWLLWIGRIRLALLPLVPLALALWAVTPRPVLLVALEGRSWAALQPDGSRIVQRSSGDSMTVASWLRRDGGDVPANGRIRAEAPPRLSGTADTALRCDPEGCLLRMPAGSIALPRGRQAELADCTLATVTIVPWRSDLCAGGWDRVRLRAAGALAVYDDLRVVTAYPPDMARPWIPVYRSATTAAEVEAVDEAPADED